MIDTLIQQAKERWEKRYNYKVDRIFDPVVEDFMPKDMQDFLEQELRGVYEKMKEPEFIICSAIMMKDGYVIRGHRHNDAIRTASDIPRYSKEFIDEQGFITSTGRFVGREEAHIIAGMAKQISNEKFNKETMLYSEDLY